MTESTSVGEPQYGIIYRVRQIKDCPTVLDLVTRIRAEVAVLKPTDVIGTFRVQGFKEPLMFDEWYTSSERAAEMASEIMRRKPSERARIVKIHPHRVRLVLS